jgi:nucleoside-diphosphate-sugar epimerase
MAIVENLRKKLSGRKTLVVGGRGFIGSHLVTSLLDTGALVTTLSHSESSNPFGRDGLEHLTGDIRDPVSMRRCLSKREFDYVINSGGYIDHRPYFSGGRDLIDQHFSGTMNLLDLVKHPDLMGYVQIGSSDEYGTLEAPQKEDSREAPISPYSVGKVAAAHLLQMLQSTENLPAVIVRLFLVYGPGQDHQRFLPQVIRGCLANRDFETSEGRQVRDFCYVDDVVSGILSAMVSEEAHGKVINVASGRPVTIREVIEKVILMVGGGKADFGRIPYRKGENMSLYADISLAKKILGWQPATDIDEGLRRTIEWYRKTPKAQGGA